MKKTVTVKEGQNSFVVSLEGDQTFVRIRDAAGEVIRESRAAEQTKLEQIADPGKYTVETDGTIANLKATRIETEIDPNVAE